MEGREQRASQSGISTMVLSKKEKLERGFPMQN